MAKPDSPFLQIRERVVGWLTKQEYAIAPDSSPNAHWVVGAHRDFFPLVVAMPVANPDRIVLSSHLALQDWERFHSVLGKSSEEFIWDLRFRLLHMDVGFSGLQLPLKEFDLIEELFVDTLSRDVFLGKIRAMRNAYLAAIWSIQRRSGMAVDTPTPQPGFLH